jgi:hypothetical protein
MSLETFLELWAAFRNAEYIGHWTKIVDTTALFSPVPRIEHCPAYSRRKECTSVTTARALPDWRAPVSLRVHCPASPLLARCYSTQLSLSFSFTASAHTDTQSSAVNATFLALWNELNDLHSHANTPLEQFICLRYRHPTATARHSSSDGLRAGRPRGRSSSLDRVKSFHFSISSRPALGSTQPSVQWATGTLTPGVKQQERKAYHSPPTSAEVKKMCIYTSTPPYAFMA